MRVALKKIEVPRGHQTIHAQCAHENNKQSNPVQLQRLGFVSRKHVGYAKPTHQCERPKRQLECKRVTAGPEENVKTKNKRDGKNGAFCPSDAVHEKLSENSAEEQPFLLVEQPAGHQEGTERPGQQHECVIHECSLGYIVLDVPQVVDIVKGKKLHVSAKYYDHPNRKGALYETEPFPECSSRNASRPHPQQRNPVTAAHDRKACVERQNQQAHFAGIVKPGVKWHKHRGNEHRNVQHPVRQLRRTREPHWHPQARRHTQDPCQRKIGPRRWLKVESEIAPRRIQIVLVHPLKERHIRADGGDQQGSLLHRVFLVEQREIGFASHRSRLEWIVGGRAQSQLLKGLRHTCGGGLVFICSLE